MELSLFGLLSPFHKPDDLETMALFLTVLEAGGLRKGADRFSV